MKRGKSESKDFHVFHFGERNKMKKRIVDASCFPAKLEKRGQAVFGLSFGMIFSIFIIILIITVSFIAIKYFIGIGQCGDVGLFYKDFQDEINRAWNSGEYSQLYEDKAPDKITNVCFGNLSLSNPPSASENFIFEAFVEEHPSGRYSDDNMFLYPIDEACGGSSFYQKLEHVSLPEFFCTNVTLSNNDWNIFITFKDREQNLVNVTKSRL